MRVCLHEPAAEWCVFYSEALTETSHLAQTLQDTRALTASADVKSHGHPPGGQKSGPGCGQGWGFPRSPHSPGAAQRECWEWGRSSRGNRPI